MLSSCYYAGAFCMDQYRTGLRKRPESEEVHNWKPLKWKTLSLKVYQCSKCLNEFLASDKQWLPIKNCLPKEVK